MPISDDLRQSFLGRSSGLEGSVRRLIQEIFDRLPGSERRRMRVVLAKVDVLFAAIEDAIAFDPTDPEQVHDREIRELHERSDELFLARSMLDRRDREARREVQRLKLEEKQLHADHVVDEVDAEQRTHQPPNPQRPRED